MGRELQYSELPYYPEMMYQCYIHDDAGEWSSTQWFADTNAYSVDIPDGNYLPGDKWSSEPVRCIRDF